MDEPGPVNRCADAAALYMVTTKYIPAGKILLLESIERPGLTDSDSAPVSLWKWGNWFAPALSIKIRLSPIMIYLCRIRASGFGPETITEIKI